MFLLLMLLLMIKRLFDDLTFLVFWSSFLNAGSSDLFMLRIYLFFIFFNERLQLVCVVDVFPLTLSTFCAKISPLAPFCLKYAVNRIRVPRNSQVSM